MEMQKISILGLGLMGGSLAKAFKRVNPNYYITAMDSNPDTLKLALEEKIIDVAALNPEDAVRDAKLIFLCMPVNSITVFIEKIKDFLPAGAIVTDIGSIKEQIVNEAQRILDSKITFIGGHPMTGAEHSGYASSTPHLFENAYYILTPLSNTPPKALELLSSMISSIGAIPLVMVPSLHDEVVGSISHLPHIIASTLVNTVRGLEDTNHFKEKLAAGGFRDITRIASSNPEMWKDISILNRSRLLPLLSAMINELNKFLQWLEDEDKESILTFFEEAKVFRDNLPVRQSVTLLPYYDVYIDIEDRPGIIGEIATLLGYHEINIKNLRIINSREDEPGCLVLSLPDANTLRKASAILADKGYRIYIR